MFLSNFEFEKLKEKFPIDYEKRISDLDIYISSSGKEYKNHFATICEWAIRKNDVPKIEKEIKINNTIGF